MRPPMPWTPTHSRGVLLRVQYDGTAFAGFQRQQDGIRSVAGVIEDAWRTMLGEDIIARGSSRTDSGVHARRMPVLIRTDKDVPLRGLMLGLNVLLPLDCKIVSVEEVPEYCDVRADAVGKRYVYHVQTGPALLPLWRGRAWHIKARLDLELAEAAARRMAGIHDYAAFRSVHCTAHSTSRHIRSVELKVIDDTDQQRVLALTVEGNAFLHNMVRIMAGTVVDVGRKRRTLAQLEQAFMTGDRLCAGPTAPAHGLTLDDVFFGPWGERLGQDYKSLLDHIEVARTAPKPAV